MAVTVNDQMDSNMLTFGATRLGWNVKMRRDDGTLMPVAEGNFSPMLELDTNYKFEFETTGNTVTVRVPGSEVTKNLPTVGLLGDRAFWQEYPLRAPAAQVFDFDTVWAVEDGQPLFPVPVPANG
ncbi:hypothetical protein BH09ACT7_BH09ACT7_49770 [soil metagenome]